MNEFTGAHSPRLETILLIENAIRKSPKDLTRTGLYHVLAGRVMYQTLKVILDYLEKSNKITYSGSKIVWIFTNPKSGSVVSAKTRVFDKIVSILSRHGAKRVSLFGSYSRGEQKPTSDIDLIVEFRDRKSLLDLVSVEDELSSKVGKKVDLLTENSISPYIAQRIVGERKVLFG